MPGPPHSSGVSMPQQPISPSLCRRSRGNRSSRSSSFTCGRTSVCMNCRTVSRMSFWWSVREKSIASYSSTASSGNRSEGGLQLEELAQPLGLLAAYRDFGVLLVVHFEHVARLEPGNDFFDVM